MIINTITIIGSIMETNKDDNLDFLKLVVGKVDESREYKALIYNAYYKFLSSTNYIRNLRQQDRCDALKKMMERVRKECNYAAYVDVENEDLVYSFAIFNDFGELFYVFTKMSFRDNGIAKKLINEELSHCKYFSAPFHNLTKRCKFLGHLTLKDNLKYEI